MSLFSNRGECPDCGSLLRCGNCWHYSGEDEGDICEEDGTPTHFDGGCPDCVCVECHAKALAKHKLVENR